MCFLTFQTLIEELDPGRVLPSLAFHDLSSILLDINESSFSSLNDRDLLTLSLTHRVSFLSSSQEHELTSISIKSIKDLIQALYKESR